MTGDVLLRLENVGVALGGRDVLSSVSLDVRKGEFIAVVGPNGAGKTTLLKAMASLVPADGKMEIDGVSLAHLAPSARAQRIAYLPQGNIFHWPLPVEEIVALGRLPGMRGAELSQADRDAVRRAMAVTEVDIFAGRMVTTLSGGERARVALARVLATEAPLVLADEPTASLDPRYQLIVLDILRERATRDGAVIAVLHDLGLAARYADRVIVLDKGRSVALGTPATVLTDSLLAETFGIVVRRVASDGQAVIVPWSTA